MLSDESCVRRFCMNGAARGTVIACDGRKQTLDSLNRPQLGCPCFSLCLVSAVPIS